MPQLPLLCLHQSEPRLLPEHVLSAQDCTHCDRDHQDKSPPDANQCSSAGVIQDRESEKMVTKECCSLISSTQVRSDRTSYLLAQNQWEATFTPCMVQQWSSLPQDTAKRAMGHLPGRTTKPRGRQQKERTLLRFRRSLSPKLLETGKVFREYHCIPPVLSCSSPSSPYKLLLRTAHQGRGSCHLTP